MTERKPPGVPFESWVDKQIREAAERGAFDDLPGAGKPLAALDRPYDELWWIREKMAREGLSQLPTSLRLRKEVEDAMHAASRAPSEREVRRIVEEVNDRIRAGLRTPMDGPPLGLVPYDVEDVVARWRAERG
ncbi:DUF1992 domain-containing protein [Actinacidiphila sp. bgisy167]|uniref:DnaJ family domain-containing protein n=1 Tax=Actinacidiphila sp. bgisy167 TaxID=3413797 RepID=UPI003D7075E0